MIDNRADKVPLTGLPVLGETPKYYEPLTLKYLCLTNVRLCAVSEWKFINKTWL